MFPTVYSEIGYTRKQKTLLVNIFFVALCSCRQIKLLFVYKFFYFICVLVYTALIRTFDNESLLDNQINPKSVDEELLLFTL